MQQRYNAIIIGFGKGGKTLAAYLADQRQSVAIVERSDKMYGVPLNDFLSLLRV